MPCVVESGLEAREADSFEYRRAALDRLRALFPEVPMPGVGECCT